MTGRQEVPQPQQPTHGGLGIGDNQSKAVVGGVGRPLTMKPIVAGLMGSSARFMLEP